MIALFTFLGIRGTIAAALGLALAVALTGLHFEHAWRLKAQAERDGAIMAGKIYQERLNLADEREKIISQASKKRGQLNDWQRKGDLDSLRDDFNAPGGVRRNLPTNPPGGAKGPAGYHDSADPGTSYTETPGQ